MAELPLGPEFPTSESNRTSVLVDDHASDVVIIVGTVDLAVGGPIDEEIFVWPVDMSNGPINIAGDSPQQPTTTLIEQVFVNDFLVGGDGTITLLGDEYDGLNAVKAEAWTLGGGPGAYTLDKLPSIGAEPPLDPANSKILFGFQGAAGSIFIGGKSNGIIPDTSDIWLGRLGSGRF